MHVHARMKGVIVVVLGLGLIKTTVVLVYGQERRIVINRKQ